MAALVALDDVGKGDPLILLHGIATDRHIWDLVVPELASERRVVTLDLPGFGGSAPVGEDFDLERVAERIVHGLTGRGIHGPFDLVGHSLGGGIAITLAAMHPRLVRRLVLVAPAGLRPFPATVSNVLAAAADAVLAARRGAVSLTEVWWGRKLLLSLTAADGAELPPTLARQLVEASATAQRTARGARDDHLRRPAAVTDAAAHAARGDLGRGLTARSRSARSTRWSRRARTPASPASPTPATCRWSSAPSCSSRRCYRLSKTSQLRSVSALSCSEQGFSTATRCEPTRKIATGC